MQQLLEALCEWEFRVKLEPLLKEGWEVVPGSVQIIPTCGGAIHKHFVLLEKDEEPPLKSPSQEKTDLSKLLEYLRKHENWHKAYAARKDNENYPQLVESSKKEAEHWGGWANAVEKAMKLI